MLSCVVVNYHTPDDLHRFVMSWVSQSFKDTELIVVDVSPTHEETSRVAEWLSPLQKEYGIQYWPLDYNSGYSGACNFAAAVCSGDVYAFFNADTTLNDETLESCYEGIKSDDTWAILGPLQYDSSGRCTAGGIFGTNMHPKHRGWRSRDLGSLRDVREDAVTVAGSAFFVKADVFWECAEDEGFQALYPDIGGAFLPTPHYYEETWLCYFARAKGYKAVYYGKAEMIHEWHQASNVGGKTEKEYKPKSQKMFRDACTAIGIECD